MVSVTTDATDCTFEVNHNNNPTTLDVGNIQTKSFCHKGFDYISLLLDVKVYEHEGQYHI